MFNDIRTRLANLLSPIKNSMDVGREFLKYGGKRMVGDWSTLQMRDSDSYVGYSYAAIEKRAVYTAQVAAEYVKVDDDAKTPDLEHPYLPLIYNSPNFTETEFWQSISRYLDLKGIAYLLAARNKVNSRIGNLLYFDLLNPYDITRILDPQTLKVVGYVENRGGVYREIPPSQIIEFRKPNPFKSNDYFSNADAAKNTQFTLLSSGDYTRHVIKGNINAPGIISTDVMLKPEVFQQFKDRIVNHEKGEPLFGNGSGAINWESMTSDLSKSALKDVHDTTRQQSFAVYGVSKTIMGIEESGTTRDTARVQMDLFIKSEIMPQIQRIIDTLNMDYRNNYPADYKNNNLYLYIDNPLESDHDAEKTETDVKDGQYNLYTKLIQSGYTPKKAALYVKGDIDVEALGKPKTLPQDTTTQPTTDTTPTNSVKKKDITENAVEVPQDDLMAKQEFLLQNSVANVDGQLTAAVIQKIEKTSNAYDVVGDIIKLADKNRITAELEEVLRSFYGVVIANEAIEVMKERALEFDLPGTFHFDRLTKANIKELSIKVSESHIDTVLDELLVTTREAALEGLGQREIVSRIKQKYTDDIRTTRAKLVARTETNRAFTRAQYEADRQFLDQNDLSGKAYKRWKTRSDNPCPFCESLEAEGLIPFDQNFRDLGSDITVGKGADKKTLAVSFEALEAGNAHPNCSCIYELVIKFDE